MGKDDSRIMAIVSLFISSLAVATMIIEFTSFNHEVEDLNETIMEMKNKLSEVDHNSTYSQYGDLKQVDGNIFYYGGERLPVNDVVGMILDEMGMEVVSHNGYVLESK
ncbi:TPA: hypothetical protein DIC62_00610 [Candidatus Nomurabacteria bacterium]|nr:hypothetical protein [Candidatus Nomurabacteria bacterium]